MVTCVQCGQAWEIDPALLVPCPTCHVKVGQRCKRPSGHGVWGGEPHPDRDRVAMNMVPGYGRCLAIQGPAESEIDTLPLFKEVL